MSEKKTSQVPTLFAVDSPVKTYRSRGIARGLKAKGLRSGRSSIVSFAKFAQDGSLLKMSQGYYQVTMESSLQKFSENFPRAGMMRNGELYRHPTWERRTSENDCLLLPTPTATLGLMGFCKRDAIRSASGEKRASGASIGVSLRWSPDLLPFYKDGQGSQFVNPLLSEWMMGFPMLWSDCTQQETQ